MPQRPTCPPTWFLWASQISSNVRKDCLLAERPAAHRCERRVPAKEGGEGSNDALQGQDDQLIIQTIHPGPRNVPLLAESTLSSISSLVWAKQPIDAQKLRPVKQWTCMQAKEPLQPYQIATPCKTCDSQ